MFCGNNASLSFFISHLSFSGTSRAYKNACFIQHPYWQADDTQCEDVGCWGDDGCNDEDGYYGVAAVFLHPLCFDDTELGE